MATCPCDLRAFPPIPEIPAGLDRLPRQVAGFPEFRHALLAGIRDYPALDDWRAREGDDFGVMILEWWAYILDVLAFYNNEIANELYLRTAARETSLRRLSELIGYVPKPALAASCTLALFAEPGQPVQVPKGTAFRSDAFDGEAPQIFETNADATIDASLNAWTIAPSRPETYGTGPLLLDPRTAGLNEGQIAIFEWGGQQHAARVSAVSNKRMLDGETYVEVTSNPAPSIQKSVKVADISASRPVLRAAMNAFVGDGAVVPGTSSVTLLLDALYTQLRAGTTAVLEDAQSGSLHAATIMSISVTNVALTPSGTGTGAGTEIVKFKEESASPLAKEVKSPAERTSNAAPTVPASPFTMVKLNGSGPNWVGTASPGALTLHFNPVPAGRLVRPGRREIELQHLQASAPLAGPVAPLRLATQSRVLLRDALDAGADLAANVTDDGAGQGTLTPLGTAKPLVKPLQTPVTVHGNLVSATRGESVAEVLGSGDGAQPFQRFRLKKKPLTYLSSPASSAGRKSTLEIWVAGVRWTEVASLFTAGAEDRVYTVRQTVDGEAEITFGDGRYGARLPSGANNVRAIYRYGAGAASPPAGALRQLARPAKGVRRVVNPLAAFGGDDGDKPRDIRTAAPDAALSLGRAVSLVDFEAVARRYRGILNAAADWAWTGREQRAAVKIWFIPPSADEAEQLRGDLEAHLRAVAAPGTPISVAVAGKQSKTLAIDFAVVPDRDVQEVETSALSVLTDPDTGMLAKRNLPIGRPIFRADILAAVQAVDGVETVRGLLSGDLPAPFALTVEEGQYLDVTVVRST